MAPSYCLLNTRPIYQADALNHLVKKGGGQAISFPMMQIVMLKSSEFDNADFNSFDKIIFISQNAVAGFVAQFEKKLLLHNFLNNLKPKIYAIGLATAKALGEARFEVEKLESPQFDSEALVKLPAFQKLSDQKLLIVKGEGGREYLEKFLTKKRVQVLVCEVYKRVIAPFCTQSWHKFKQANLPVFLWTSEDSFKFFKLHCQKPANQNEFNWACKQKCVVFSERIKTVILSQGWLGKITVVSSQSNQGIMEALSSS